MKSFFVASICILSIICCKPTAKVAEEQKTAYPIKTSNDNQHILSVIIVFTGDKDKIAIDRYNFVLAESKLKEGSLIKQELKNHLKCEFTDGEGNILHTQWIENPLVQRVEGVDNNGNLVTIQDLKEEGTALVRVNFENSMSHLNIFNKEKGDYSLIQTIELLDAQN